MAIFGIGAFFDGTTDVSGLFIGGNFVGNGWDLKDSPEFEQYFKLMKVGDIIYIKSAPPGRDMTIKAIGLIADAEIRDSTNTSNLISIGRNVIWISKKIMNIKKPTPEKNNVRLNTVYEEFHPEMQSILMSAIAASIKP